jgi:hypothetical protein
MAKAADRSHEQDAKHAILLQGLNKNAANPQVSR